ncbi:hypothetical protein A3C23_03460 [Candidatus Roizmanbacteria bacterium RIFCSPHIGHO2_02_FULL_37_13b]|uniref:Uncharacterized protein n=1 Tax=Candidatus Roizmanbacteria bacterium RIFCSPLOWO2_02_FULL_36_11 TaxID=1802071 RepID=A0A1F7JC54_9BACT|nr:MAG: hypothetical protein A3C23_03460 [Candidatus Roizmanbacteria bacterium RIFCSPHIGHO2_02_FULL_37_13b]OGK53155.1 MAG: hypothetical protein A3H78_02115 [Candidatus Roizmanbacteria bacterium RIFCSPLOWO2_02_FULL_36_11]
MYLAFGANIKTALQMRIFFFILGLATFHNYLILLVIPGICFYLYRTKTIFFKKIHDRLILFLLFFLGGTPYFYYLFRAGTVTPLETTFPSNLVDLLRLIARSDYGIFRLSRTTFFSLSAATTSLLNFFNFILTDFKIIGTFFIIAGFVTILKMKDEAMKKFFIIQFIIFVVFFFYTSFPLTINFTIGTFEKYLLIPYFFLTVALLLGFKTINGLVNNRLHNKTLKIAGAAAFSISLLIYCLILFINNSPRILLLKQDFTAENFGFDVLNSVEKNSIVNLKGDTISYNSLFVKEVQHQRRDVKFINFLRLNDAKYQVKISKLYPNIKLPAINSNYDITVHDFLLFNSERFPIYSNEPLNTKNSSWLPMGILWKYYSEGKSLPDAKGLIVSNILLWNKYHSPMSGSLAKFRSLLLSDVLRTYSLGHWTFGELLFKDKQYEFSSSEYEQAFNLWPDNTINILAFAKSLIKVKQCNRAKEILGPSEKYRVDLKEVYKIYIDLYANCYKDSKNAEEFMNKFKQLNKPLY